MSLQAIPLNVLTEADHGLQIMWDAMQNCRRLSDAEFLRVMNAKAAFHSFTKEALSSRTAPVSTIQSQMSEAKAIADGLHKIMENAYRKATETPRAPQSH